MKSDIRQKKYLEIILTLSLITMVATVLFPRGLALFEKAQVSSIEYTSSSFKGGVNAVHSKWLVEPKKYIEIGRKDKKQYHVAVNDRGWPVAIRDAAKLKETSSNRSELQCGKLWKVLVASQREGSGEGEFKDVIRAKQGEDTCEYVYTLLNEHYSIIYKPMTGSVRLKKAVFDKT